MVSKEKEGTSHLARSITCPPDPLMSNIADTYHREGTLPESKNWLSEHEKPNLPDSTYPPIPVPQDLGPPGPLDQVGLIDLPNATESNHHDHPTQTLLSMRTGMMRTVNFVLQVVRVKMIHSRIVKAFHPPVQILDHRMLYLSSIYLDNRLTRD